MSDPEDREGGCACGTVRYRMTGPPIFVHCCHCTWCQRETGSAFAINAMIEADRIRIVSGEPETILTPSESGNGQKITRCPACHVALWSTYSGAGDAIRFLRAGTLDDATALKPDIHIFTSTKLPWVVLPDNVPVVPEYYRSADHWPSASLERWKAARIKA